MFSFYRNVKLQYGTGVSLGIVASLLILMIILHRVFPQVTVYFK